MSFNAETIVLKKIPKSLPYLKNRWDILDQYHQLDSGVTEEEFVAWWATVFKKFKIKTFEQAVSLQKYELLNLARRNPVNYYGTFEEDFYGGMFGCMGLYGQSFYNSFLPKDLFSSFYKNYPKSEKTNAENRFNFIMELVKKHYEL